MPATTECHISVRSQNEKFLSTFFKKLQRSRGQRPRSPVATGETPAGRSQRNPRAAHGAKYPVVPKRHPQMAQPLRQCRKAAVPTPTRVADGGLFDPPTVGRGILDAPKPHPIRGRQGCRPLRWAKWMATAVHPRRGRRRGPWPLAGGCAICGWRFERQGRFAPCAARVFRWLRPAGVSPAAAGGNFAPCAARPGALPPGPLQLF